MGSEWDAALYVGPTDLFFKMVKKEFKRSAKLSSDDPDAHIVDPCMITFFVSVKTKLLQQWNEQIVERSSYM